MFRKLRLQLTMICTAGTALVLIGMAVVSLRFSLVQLNRQSFEAFRSSVNSVLFYLRSQSAISQSWLAQTEADGGLWIRIESKNMRLQYTGQNEMRDELTRQAGRYASDYLGYEPFESIFGGLETEPLLFEMPGQGAGYYAGIAAVTFANGRLYVTVVKDRAGEQAAIRRLGAVFGLCVAAAVLLLWAFAWFFSKRAARPVEEYHRKQLEFVSAASHELRSPLAVIEMSAGTIRNMPSQSVRFAEKIERECKRMAKLISDLLFLAGSDRGQLALRMKAVLPETVLRSAGERFLPLACGKNINLKLLPPAGELPAVYCDPQLIEQILAIFLDNAISYTPAGGTILLRGERQRAGVSFSVSDSGPGIPDYRKERIFERFYRADDARSGKEHLGLGLSIAAEIAKLHGGMLSVRDAKLGGAEFVLVLPFGGNRQQAEKEPAASQSACRKEFPELVERRRNRL